jgi:hypothetical protein
MRQAVGIDTNPATTAGATAAIKWISKDALGALGRLFIGNLSTFVTEIY